MWGVVWAALTAPPTPVPTATPMMRVRRKPVPGAAIVASAMLRLVRSAPAGAPDLPPIDRRLPGRVPGALDRCDGRVTPRKSSLSDFTAYSCFNIQRRSVSSSASFGGGQVAQIDDAAVLQARVQQPPEVPRDGVRVGQLAGGVEVQEFLPARGVLRRGCPELGLHLRVDGAGGDREHPDA